MICLIILKEGDVTFRVRSYDGLDYSPVSVKRYKLNLEAPSIVVNTPAQNSQHDSNSPKGPVVSFSGTASDPYFGVNGNDIKEIWFELTEDSNCKIRVFMDCMNSYVFFFRNEAHRAPIKIQEVLLRAAMG